MIYFTLKRFEWFTPSSVLIGCLQALFEKWKLTRVGHVSKRSIHFERETRDFNDIDRCPEHQSVQRADSERERGLRALRSVWCCTCLSRVWFTPARSEFCVCIERSPAQLCVWISWELLLCTTGRIDFVLLFLFVWSRLYSDADLALRGRQMIWI